MEAEFVLGDAARGRLLSRFGEGAREWCAGLPRLVEQYCSRWDLRLEQAQSGSTSRVYLGWQRGRPEQPGRPGREVVLKVTPEPSIARAEATALRAWAATPHAVSLLDADPDGGALLLERVRPGTKRWGAGALPPAREMAELLTGLRAATGDLTGQLPPLSERIEFIFGLIRSRLGGAPVAPLVEPSLVTAGHELALSLARSGPPPSSMATCTWLTSSSPVNPDNLPARASPASWSRSTHGRAWVIPTSTPSTGSSRRVPLRRLSSGSRSCVAWSPACTPTGSRPGAGRRPSSSSCSTCITGQPTRGSRPCCGWRPVHDRRRPGSVLGRSGTHCGLAPARRRRPPTR